MHIEYAQCRVAKRGQKYLKFFPVLLCSIYERTEPFLALKWIFNIC